MSCICIEHTEKLIVRIHVITELRKQNMQQFTKKFNYMFITVHGQFDTNQT